MSPNWSVFSIDKFDSDRNFSFQVRSVVFIESPEMLECSNTALSKAVCLVWRDS